jgi:phage gpG-like protein
VTGASQATVVGVEEVIGNLGLVERHIHTRTVEVVGRLAIQLQARVKLKLSDDVLHVRTGRLRRSITSEVADDADGVQATVGTQLEYARALEMGAEQAVQAHMRTIKEAWGRALRGGSKVVAVKAHMRTVVEHSFLRSSLEEMRPEIKRQLEQVISSSINEINASGAKHE